MKFLKIITIFLLLPFINASAKDLAVLNQIRTNLQKEHAQHLENVRIAFNVPQNKWASLLQLIDQIKKSNEKVNARTYIADTIKKKLANENYTDAQKAVIKERQKNISGQILGFPPTQEDYRDITAITSAISGSIPHVQKWLTLYNFTSIVVDLSFKNHLLSWIDIPEVVVQGRKIISRDTREISFDLAKATKNSSDDIHIIHPTCLHIDVSLTYPFFYESTMETEEFYGRRAFHVAQIGTAITRAYLQCQIEEKCIESFLKSKFQSDAFENEVFNSYVKFLNEYSTLFAATYDKEFALAANYLLELEEKEEKRKENYNEPDENYEKDLKRRRALQALLKMVIEAHSLKDRSF